jgi:hypothetical protein
VRVCVLLCIVECVAVVHGCVPFLFVFVCSALCVCPLGFLPFLI